MGAMKVLDRELGDKRVSWDKGKSHEVDAAKREFDYLVKEKGYFAYKPGRRGEPGDQVREFDSTLEELILIPQKVGG